MKLKRIWNFICKAWYQDYSKPEPKPRFIEVPSPYKCPKPKKKPMKRTSTSKLKPATTTEIKRVVKPVPKNGPIKK